jgi:hypothetical protein
MGTLASELAPHADRLTPQPRVYADANVPAGLVSYLRHVLAWDVLFVLEVDDLRRASDQTHFRMARQLRRTLLTLDRDYLDDRRFPPHEGSGVLVVSAPNERELRRLLMRLDRALFRPESQEHRGADAESAEAPDSGVSGVSGAIGVSADTAGATAPAGGPLAGRKLHAHADWGRPSRVGRRGRR